MPRFGSPNIEKLKAKGDVGGLIKALEYRKDTAVRISAAKALGELKDARTVEPLIAVLKDRDWSVREAAAGALGQLGDSRAVEPLIAVLKDSGKDVHEAAADALKKLGWQE